MTDQKVVFIDGVGAGRRSVESCRDGVQWIIVGDRVYWPLSDADARRLQSACCGNGSFDGPTSSAGDCVPKTEREHAAAAREVERLAGRDALRQALAAMVSWFPSADTYRRLGFDPKTPMQVLKEAKALLSKEDTHEGVIPK